MGRLLLIDVVAAAVMVGVWYFLFARYNRRKGTRALRWVEVACSSRAHIVEAHWIGASRLQAHLRFAAHFFENARVTIRLLPRPIPIQWLLSRWHNQRETVTFEADLDYVPGIRLEVCRHRWLTHRTGRVRNGASNWVVSRPGPVVLTTSTQWRRELPPIVHTLMTSRGHDLISVRFGPNSPHLAATIDLEALSGEEAAASFLGVVRDLAAGASTSRQ
ncbi:MAG TPA: hypothetical protein VEI26_17895 [Terriglobales bacterium]|nr:hypothetical protein [Terriglobales bacterium]